MIGGNLFGEASGPHIRAQGYRAIGSAVKKVPEDADDVRLDLALVSDWISRILETLPPPA